MKKSSIMMMAVCALALCTLCAVPANAGEYFKKTEVQLHADFARDKGFEDANGEGIEESIITATFAHVSEWKYGDNFGFFDLEGKDDYEFGIMVNSRPESAWTRSYLALVKMVFCQFHL